MQVVLLDIIVHLAVHQERINVQQVRTTMEQMLLLLLTVLLVQLVQPVLKVQVVLDKLLSIVHRVTTVLKVLQTHMNSHALQEHTHSRQTEIQTQVEQHHALCATLVTTVRRVQLSQQVHAHKVTTV